MFKVRGSTTRERIKFCETITRPHLIFGAGTYRNTAVFHRKINALQQKLSNFVQHFIRFRGEADGSYFYRRNKSLKELRIREYIARWSDVLNARYYEFAGHLGRLKLYDPARLTVSVMQWKDIESLERLQYTTGTQGHAQRLRVWRWEQPIFNFFKQHSLRWQNVCLDREWWESWKLRFKECFRIR